MAEEGKVVRYTRRPDQLDRPTPRVDGAAASVTCIHTDRQPTQQEEEQRLKGPYVLELRTVLGRNARNIMACHCPDVPIDQVDAAMQHLASQDETARQDLFSLRVTKQYEYLLLDKDMKDLPKSQLEPLMNAAIARARNMYPKGDMSLRPDDAYVRSLHRNLLSELTDAFDKIALQQNSRGI